MRCLLDTHAALWAMEGDARLGKKARSHLEGLGRGQAVIADVSLLEIAMLAAKGRIELSVPVGDYLQRVVRLLPVVAIDPEIAEAAFQLDLAWGDPFDRVIVATAHCRRLDLISRDENMHACGIVKTIW